MRILRNYLLLLVFFTTTCARPSRNLSPVGDSDIDISGYAQEATLLIANTQPSMDPVRGTLHILDTTNKNSKIVRAGESSDPLLASCGDHLLLFNRSATQLNASVISLDSNKLRISREKILPLAQPGDPHGVLCHGSKVVLGHYSAGKLAALSLPDFGLLQEITAELDLPEGAYFRPENIVAFEQDNKKHLAVIHQGLAIDSTGVHPNGSQQVFIFAEDAAGTFQAVDMDPNAAKIQGIKLSGSFPVLAGMNGTELVVLSLCSTFATPAASGLTCKSAVEYVDLAKREVKDTWDLSQEEIFMNGNAVFNKDATKIWAQTQRPCGQADKILHKGITLFDRATKTMKTVYLYPETSSGAGALFYHGASNTLFAGDWHPTTGGKILRIDAKNGGVTADFPTPGSPYSIQPLINQEY